MTVICKVLVRVYKFTYLLTIDVCFRLSITDWYYRCIDLFQVVQQILVLQVY